MWVLSVLVLLIGLIPPTIVQIRQAILRQQCFNNLVTIDHSLNCGGLVPGPPGTPIDPKTVPFDGWHKQGETKTHSIRNCPCGPTYQVDFRVGAHPICPVHGDLVGKSGFIHHVREPDPLPPVPYPKWGFATSSISIVFGILLIVAARKNKRKKGIAQSGPRD